jgi:hypothetical protein
MKRIEIDPGTKFGRLTAVERRGLKWLCRCDCGAEKEIQAGSLRYGYTKSCGCLLRAKGIRNVTHGHSASGIITPTYTSWYAMRGRCLNPRNPKYARYGGRGIKICAEWMTFEGFISSMGERPAGTTLDRFPNRDGDYEPSNCRWATASEQAFNRDCVIDDVVAMQVAWMVADAKVPRVEVAAAFQISKSTIARIAQRRRPGIRPAP